MTVLIGGLRSLGISHTGEGIWSEKKLDNSWFKTLLSMEYRWEKNGFNSFVGIKRQNENKSMSASRIDLILGSNSELRAICEVYAQNDNNDKFKKDFVCAWNKVMNADRFDLR